jgi:hypothetical protein
MNAPQCSVTTVTNVNLFEINLNFQFVSNKMAFSQEQKIYIVESYFRSGHLIDGEWQYSIEACCEEFRQQFPDATLTYNIFHHNLTQCIQISRETGSVDRKKGSGRPTKRIEEAIANVRQVMEEVPRTSVRRLSQQVQLSTSTCHNIFKKDIHLYPYRLQAVQQLLEADYPVRVEYCYWFLNTTNENLLNWSFFSTNLGSTWTVMSTHKTCDGGVQKNLISLNRFLYTPKGGSLGGYFKTQDYWTNFF